MNFDRESQTLTCPRCGAVEHLPQPKRGESILPLVGEIVGRIDGFAVVHRLCLHKKGAA